MQDWVKVLEAADAAARWHAGQRRKGANQTPYMNHLVEVARLVAEASGGDDVDLVVAAFLHDTIEDQGVTHAELVQRFGSEVADVVQEVTDDKSLPKEERKRLQVAHAPHKSTRAALIKLADKTSNVREVLRDPGVGWSAERRLQYVYWARTVVAALPKVNPGLLLTFEQAAAETEAGIRDGR